MSQRPQPPRGMRDTLPAEARTKRHLLDRILTTYASYGYDQIETPMLEELGRLVDSEAGENDKLIYKVLRRGIDWSGGGPSSERDAVDLGLRYDLTVPLARYFATNQNELSSPFKAIQTGSVFRAERPQKGRYRQFTQCDIDVIGSDSSYVEAELLCATSDALRACGLTGFVFRINDRKLLDRVMQQCGIAEHAKGRVLITLDKLDKIGTESVIADLDEIQTGCGKSLMESMVELRDANDSDNWTDDVNAIVAALDGSDVDIVLDPFLVRGMGYYTGSIFEIHHPGLGMSMGGGGRYDAMVERLSGIDAPAAGISIGFERLMMILEGTEVSTEQRAVLLYDKTTEHKDVLGAVRALRTQGFSVRAEVGTKNRGAQLRRLSKLGFTHSANISGQLVPLTEEGDK